MSRAVLWSAALLFAAAPALAQAPNPLDLVRGLREHGLHDLALEYLKEIEKGNPSGEIRTTLPLERAKVHLQLAEQEGDEGAKDAAIAQAKAEFQTFLKDNAKHPRAPEASVALARVIALQANTQLGRVGRLTRDKQTAAAAAVRPQFREAAGLLGKASKQLAELVADPNLDPIRRKDLTREALEAELDRGKNLFRMADTFDTGNPAEVVERGKVIDEAQAVFDGLWRREPKTATSWVARAWVGTCLLEKQETTKADDLYKQIKADAGKAGPEAAAGVRMVEFFEAQYKFLAARGNPQLVRPTRDQLKSWLDRDREKARMTPERLSALVYYAELTEALALQSGVSTDQKTKQLNVSGTARGLLQEANQTFKRIAETDNPYTERAQAGRTKVLRLLVGNADQPAEKFSDFEQCHIAALVKLSEANQEKDDARKRADLYAAAVRLLERCRHLHSPGVSAKDEGEAALQLAVAYLSAGQSYNAAILGEYLARHGKPAAVAARGGAVAVVAYMDTMRKLEEGAAAEAKGVDRDRAVDLARFLDATYPSDPQTDSARYRLGLLFFEEKQFQPAFEVLAKIGPGYAGAAAARALEGRAAYALVVGKDTPVGDAEKPAVFRKAVADAEAVPEPPPTADTDGARLYLSLRILLANLYVANKDYAKAERTATEAEKKAAGFTHLSDAQKKAAGFAAEEVRLRAIFAQAHPLYLKKDFKGLGERLGPALAEMARTGPANKDLDGEAAVAADALDRFRQEVIRLAIQAAIREGGAGTGDLFDLLEKFGGSADAVVGLVSQLRPQIEELRKEKKTEEADKLAESVAAVLEKLAANPKLPPKTVAQLGRGLRGVGAFGKAIAVLAKVLAPPAEDLRKRPADIADEAARDKVTAYQIARLELARAYRGAKQLDKAGDVLKDALGDAKAPGWAKSLEYRKEAVLLAEDRAADAPPPERLAKWKEATTGWGRLVTEYQAAVTKPPKAAAGNPQAMAEWQRDREKLIPVYLVLFCDYQRCMARGNSQLVTDPAKRDEKLSRIGQTVAELEAANERALSAEVRAAFGDLLVDYPAVRAGYQKAGGKVFLAAAGGQ
jgi:hypothetical protein